jgi:hypothetical protein
MDELERVSRIPDGRGEERALQKPSATIGCSVCLAENARVCAVRLQHGQCTVSYRCSDCGHVEDRVLP